jgi:UDP-glucose 4-epimerase
MSADVVLVTGGAGFVGSHLVEALLGAGHEVHVFDRLALEDAANLAPVAGHQRLRYTRGDLLDREQLRAFFRPDASVIYHLASVVGVKNYIADPLRLIDIVVGGTRSTIELAREHGVKMVFTSTSEIYGKNPAVPWPESGDRVLGPTSVDRWSYSSSKAVCEHMIFGVHRQSGWPFTIVRFFNVYGPRQNPYYVVSQSVYRALRGEAPYLYDDGAQTRCFTYVSDIVAALIVAWRHPKSVGEVFNLGNPVESTIREVIDLVLDCAGSDAKPIAFDTTVEYGATYEDIPRRIPAVDRAHEILGWKAETPLAEGIAKTVAWARDNEWWLADQPR